MDSTSHSVPIDSEIFDYVIIGGGTAGLVLAVRLTEDPSIHVAVLEAGEKRLEDPKINIPGLMNTLYGDDNYDWNFKTAPQEALNNRTIAWPRGKVLGGTSAINFLMATHASRVDLDNWEKLGNPGWNFDTLQPFYRKSETYNPPSEATAKELGTYIIDPELHGKTGPIQTNFPVATGPFDQAFAPTFAALGLDPKKDPREGETLGGYALLKFMDSKAKRSYTASAYYVPNKGRKNLVVVTNALAKTIEFEKREEVATATSVKYSVAGVVKLVRTRGEVILSAGTVKSPQLLELSGIGSRAHLEKLGIDVVMDNANVGENLQDHPLLGLAYEAQDGVPTAEMLKQQGVLDWALNEWAEKGAGPLATGVSGTAFISYTSILPQDQKPLLERQIASLTAQVSDIPNQGLAKQLELQKELLLNGKEADIQYNFGATGINPQAGNDVANFFSHNDPGGYAGLVTVLTHAFSRGSIHIQSSDPEVYPLIDPRYLSHPLDLEIIINGVLFTQKVSETEPLASLLKSNSSGNGKKIQPSFKVPASEEKITKETALRIVRESTVTSFHPMSTCSMLPREYGGVVDGRLRVYGTANVRVVDASIFPLAVRGNIESLVLAVAERAAGLILEDRVK